MDGESVVHMTGTENRPPLELVAPDDGRLFRQARAITAAGLVELMAWDDVDDAGECRTREELRDFLEDRCSPLDALHDDRWDIYHAARAQLAGDS